MDVFGQAPQGEVRAVWIGTGALRAKVLSLGAILSDLQFEGCAVVLGSDRLEDYLGPMAYFGSIVGRVANRIAGASALIGGVRYHFDANEAGVTCLHGGSDGAQHQLWKITEVGTDHVTLETLLPDGHMGFPGAMKVQAMYRTDGAVLNLTIRAQTDAVTLCNFAPHSYLNLAGEGTIKDHHLQIAAEQYLALTQRKTPVGAPENVAGTRLDFRAGRRIGDGHMDHNFCLDDQRRALTPVLHLSDPISGRALELATTEPGLQIYTAGHLADTPLTGRGGHRYGAGAGIAIEPQGWPDAPNQPGYPPILLRPGETYCAVTEYRFSNGTTKRGEAA